MQNILIELSGRLPDLQLKLLDHLLYLTAIPVVVAVCIALPLAIWARNHRVFQAFALGTTGIMQTIPSLAMLAFLLPFLGIGKLPAIVALTLYALLPIFQNTLTALRELPSDVLEAADGIGFSKHQRLWMIDLPLAAPVIMSGIRTATTICVGIATLSTFIGAGGLGDFINRGLALDQMPLVLLGAGTAAVLALFLDFVMETVGLFIRPGRKKRNLRWRAIGSIVVVIMLFGVLVFPLKAGNGVANNQYKKVIRIGSKNFTEQFILGEIMAQIIENHTDLYVERIFNLGGTVICQKALENGEIDLYPEYSGTSLSVVFKSELQPGWTNKDIFNYVKALYEKNYGCTVLGPFGFNNTYRLTVSGKKADKHGWRTVSDLALVASSLDAGFTSEFIEREDGLKGLAAAYNLHFRQVRDMSPELMYKAVANGEIDVICAFSTDGRIAAYDLRTLDDDLQFFPPYEAMPVVRKELLRKFPEVEDALKKLIGLISDNVMRELNYKVDVEKVSPEKVAEIFLKERNLLMK